MAAGGVPAGGAHDNLTTVTVPPRWRHLYSGHSPVPAAAFVSLPQPPPVLPHTHARPTCTVAALPSARTARPAAGHPPAMRITPDTHGRKGGPAPPPPLPIPTVGKQAAAKATLPLLTRHPTSPCRWRGARAPPRRTTMPPPCTPPYPSTPPSPHPSKNEILACPSPSAHLLSSPAATNRQCGRGPPRHNGAPFKRAAAAAVRWQRSPPWPTLAAGRPLPRTGRAGRSRQHPARNKCRRPRQTGRHRHPGGEGTSSRKNNIIKRQVTKQQQPGQKRAKMRVRARQGNPPLVSAA